MNGLPYYKAYPRDFIEGTIGMPFELKCAYRVVLDLIYMQGGQLPDDARYISGLLGCSVRKWKSIRLDLIERDKLQVNGAFLSNYRADNELETLRKVSAKQAENASRPRKNNDVEKPRLNHTESEPEPYTENTTLNARDVCDALMEAAGPAMADPARSPGVMVMSEPLSWIRSGADPDLDILPTVRAKSANRPPGSIGSWAYFTRAIMEAKARREAGHETPEIENDQPSRKAKYGGVSERGRAASEQRKSAWLDAVAELDGGGRGDARPERPGGDYGGDRRIAPIARTG